jgi:phosphatidylinositol glycan class V
VYCPHLINDSFKYYFNFDGLILSRKAGEHDRPWCDKIFPNVSSMYMFIQMEYWNVGLFKYYEMKQIPNFLLALPMILMCSHLLAYFFLVPIRKTTKHENVFLLSANASNLRPYCIHLLLLLLNALLVVHIQVTTRLLTACPPVFWGPASFFCNKIPGKYEKAVIGYFLLFNVLGSVLFSTFYPWT